MNFKRTNTEEEFRNKLIPKKIKISKKIGFRYSLITIDNHAYIMHYNETQKVFYAHLYHWFKVVVKELNIPHKENNGYIYIKQQDVDLNGYELP